MTLFADRVVVVRGGGDLGSGVIWRLRRVGFPVVVTELARPLTVRRSVAYSSAVTDGAITIEGIRGVRVGSGDEAIAATRDGAVPVLVDRDIPDLPVPPTVVVDARIAKRNLGTNMDQAPFVVGLGPGFSAGQDCHAVIETMRGHDLGRVIWSGPAEPDSGTPGEIGGETNKRVLRAAIPGELTWTVAFGDLVERDQPMGSIDGSPVRAKIAGTVRGLILPGPVTPGLKIGDVDPRFDPSAIHRISDKALSIGGAVLESILVWMNEPGR